VCRAVVTARQLAPQADLLAVFRALQHAFYVDGLDTTDGQVLAQVAVAALEKQGVASSAAAFHLHWSEPATVAATHAEFVHARAIGVRSFPALLLEADNRLIEISPGYASAAQLDNRLSALLAHEAHSA
jgi:putative protein-disulfide isomerase